MQTNQHDLIGILRLAAQVAPLQLWAESLHASGLLTELLKVLIDDKAETTLLSAIIIAMARLSLNDATIFFQLISVSAISMGKPESEVVNGVLDQWWRRVSKASTSASRTVMLMSCYSSTICPSHGSGNFLLWASRGFTQLLVIRAVI